MTAIKLKLQQNQYLVKPAELPKTALEKKLLIKQGYDLLNEEIKELKLQLQDALQRLNFMIGI